MSEPATYPGAGADDVRPMVRTADAGNLSLWIFGAIVSWGRISPQRLIGAGQQPLFRPRGAPP